MVAIENRVYAQIVNDTVQWIFTINELPEWDETYIVTIDVTDFATRPKVGWKYFNESFISSEIFSLDSLQKSKKAQIEKACQDKIYSGYYSEALGSLHLYPSKDRDQANMIASVTDSYNPTNLADWTTPFWCADSNSLWAYQLHTAAQIQKAGSDGKKHIIIQLSKNALLQYQITQTTTKEQIEAIVW